MNKDLLLQLITLVMGEETKKESTINKTDSEYSIGDYVIVRSYYSGVIYGKYMGTGERGGIVLHNSRRLWYRQAKSGISLSEVSKYGIKKDSKVTESVNIEIVDSTVCEILKCSQECIKTIDEQDVYQP